MSNYADRHEAGRHLVRHLEHYRRSDAVVVGIARGGVVVAAAVADELGLPLDAVIVRKLGARGREEFAVGAIAEGTSLLDPNAVRWAGMSEEDIASVQTAERAELERRQRTYVSAATPLEGRVAIVIDDGVATGASATVACRALRARGPSSVVLAVPVAPAAWRPEPDVVDEYVCAMPAERFQAVGQFYDRFSSTTDEEVLRHLGRRTS